jgi:hypothetical protein
MLAHAAWRSSARRLLNQSIGIVTLNRDRVAIGDDERKISSSRPPFPSHDHQLRAIQRHGQTRDQFSFQEIEPVSSD